MNDASGIDIGTILHTRFTGSGWIELRVVGETPQSWLTETVMHPEHHNKYKVLKRDMSYAAFPGDNSEGYRSVRQTAYTTEGKAALIEDYRLRREFRDLLPRLQEAIGQCTFDKDRGAVHFIADILRVSEVAEGKST